MCYKTNPIVGNDLVQGCIHIHRQKWYPYMFVWYLDYRKGNIAYHQWHMLMSGLQGINQEYYDAAAIDGAGKIKQFTRITLPLLTPTLFFVLIISLINSFQLFTQIMIMTPDGGPLGSTMVMVERIYKCGFRYYEMGTAAAYSWILFAILLLLTMVQMKLQNKWVNYDD